MNLLMMDFTYLTQTLTLTLTLTLTVQKLDKLLLTGSQKMWIFDTVLMSRISWDLLIHDMSPCFVAGLGAHQT